MISFEHTYYLYFLLLVPVVILFWIWRERRNRKLRARLGNPENLKQVILSNSRFRSGLRLLISVLIFSTMIIALANPRMGLNKQKINREGVDLVIAIDVSKSMTARDVLPDRLTRSKQLVERLLQNLTGHRVGIVVFAGNAYRQLPLTLDHSAALLMLDVIGSETAPNQGTALESALMLSQKMLSTDGNDLTKGGKVILILSDGEDHETGAKKTAEQISNEGIRIYTIGVGTIEGGNIPDGNDLLRDEDDNIVLTKLVEESLVEVAEIGNGRYFRLLSVNQIVDELTDDFENERVRTSEEYVYTDHRDHFQWILLFSFGLIITELMISIRWRRA